MRFKTIYCEENLPFPFQAICGVFFMFSILQHGHGVRITLPLINLECQEAYQANRLAESLIVRTFGLRSH
jgi:hypothetical protein